jgi:hypothetical protein
MELTKEQEECDHGVIFDEEYAKTITDSWEVRKLFPRLSGECPKGCGYTGIAYASFLHYVSGDW